VGDPDRLLDAGTDANRPVDIADDEAPPLPEQTSDDTDEGWAEPSSSNDDRLLAERPPHWD
jgi:hypothetical protein